MELVNLKICKRCEFGFPMTADYFHRNSSHKDGFDGSCKVCRKKQKDLYRLLNPIKPKQRKVREVKVRYKGKTKEEILEQRRRYQNLHGKELYARKMQNANRVHLYQQQYYKKNLKRITAYLKKWRLENKEKCNVAHQKYIAIKKSLPSTLSIDQWECIKRDFNFKCAYCGKEKPLTQEHFIPLSKGGEFTVNNIIPACKSCNSSKSNNAFNDWYPRSKHYSKKREKIILDYLNYKDGVQQLVFN